MLTQKKKRRNKEDYASNASSKHIQVGELLSSGIFANMIVYQEYPVSAINESCINNRYRVDWYIKNLNVAIEIHGQHHYEPTTYGGVDLNTASKTFRKQVYKDIAKIEFLKQAKCPVIEIHYQQIVTEEWLLSRIKEESEKIIGTEE